MKTRIVRKLDLSLKSSPISLKKILLKAEVLIPLSSIFLALLISLTLLVLNPILPSNLPLFYSLGWGHQQLASKSQFFILPAAIVLIVLTNIMINWQLHTKQIFFRNMLIFTSVIIGIILTVSFLKIIFLFL